MIARDTLRTGETMMRKTIAPILKCFAITALAGALFLHGGARAAPKKVVLGVKPIYQTDYPEVLFEFQGKGRTIKESGCGVICVSMALNFLVPEAEQTPESLFITAFEEGKYHGSGLSQSVLVGMLKRYGLDPVSCGAQIRWIRRAIRSGYPIIAYMGEGRFSNGGHYILLCGINHRDDGSSINMGGFCHNRKT